MYCKYCGSKMNVIIGDRHPDGYDRETGKPMERWVETYICPNGKIIFDKHDMIEVYKTGLLNKGAN